MYIFELIYKIIEDRKNRAKKPDLEEFQEEECEHVFLPVDSTKKVFACIKCGEIKKVKGED